MVQWNRSVMGRWVEGRHQTAKRTGWAEGEGGGWEGGNKGEGGRYVRGLFKVALCPRRTFSGSLAESSLRGTSGGMSEELMAS